MLDSPLKRLAVLVLRDREVLLDQWEKKVRELPSARHLSKLALKDHIPMLIGELAEALNDGDADTIPWKMAGGTPPEHGRQRLVDGFELVEVVAEYNILRCCIHDLAMEHQISIEGRIFYIVHGVIDTAIGLAVETYTRCRALDIQHKREEYLSFVTHDLLTPLNAISLASSFLARTLPNRDAATDRMLKTLSRNIDNLAGQVKKVMQENDHLETEVGMKLERRMIDLWPLVESLIFDLNPISGTGSTRLINNIDTDLQIYADAGLLKRIIQNLLANAIRHTPRGEIVLTAETLTTSGSEGTVVCRISDNGTGIPADRIARVFDKFETDPGRIDGAGLGLAIIKTFVDAHGGTVTVESVEGQGATFQFSLPGQPKQ